MTSALPYADVVALAGQPDAESGWRITAQAPASPIVIQLNAVPGASLDAIRNAVLNEQTTTTHAEILIFQGGKNTALYTATTQGMRDYYRGIIESVSWRASSLGLPLFVQEVTPIIPEVMDQRGTDGAHYNANILAANDELAATAPRLGIEIIAIHDLFQSNYSNTDPLAWCRNPSNSGTLDGSHLSEYGTRELGRAWWGAIRAQVLDGRDLPVQIAIYGDSISAATYLPDNKKPAAWLVHFALQSVAGTSGWSEYR